MTTTEKMFRFPVRIYDPLQSDATIDAFTNLNLIPEMKWIRAWKRIFFEDIIDIGDSFFSEVPIDDVIRDGFQSSTINTTEYTYTCDWPLSVLERKLDEHIQRVIAAENPKSSPSSKSKSTVNKNSSDTIALTS